MYGADPNALAVAGRLYVLCSRDPSSASRSWDGMRDYALYSTDEMGLSGAWTNHGVVLSPGEDFGDAWPALKGKKYWAPGMVFLEGWFYAAFPFMPVTGDADDVVARSPYHL